MTSVTMIGLGSMGSALASAFLANGHTTTVWNRSPEKVRSLAAKGALAANTVADAISASPLIVVCLPTTEVVRKVLEPVAAELDGRVLVNLTTGTPGDARELAAWATGHGAEYVDGAIIALPAVIGTPEAMQYYSGSRDAFERHSSTLAALGTNRFVDDDPGAAEVHDLAMLSGIYGMGTGAFHAFALVRAHGRSTADIANDMVPALAAMAQVLPLFAAEVDAGTVPQADTGLSGHANVLAAVLRGSREQGLGTELLAPLHALMAERVAAGRGSDSLSSLVELLAERAGTTDSAAIS